MASVGLACCSAGAAGLQGAGVAIAAAHAIPPRARASARPSACWPHTSLPAARTPDPAQKLEKRCRKDGPPAAFSSLDHTELPALRAHVHDTARRCAGSQLLSRRGGAHLLPAASPRMHGREQQQHLLRQCLARCAAAQAPHCAMPAARLPARPPARRGRIHAARSLASAVASFAASAALLLLDAGAELDELGGGGVGWRGGGGAAASRRWQAIGLGWAGLFMWSELVWAGLGWAGLSGMHTSTRGGGPLAVT